MDALSFSKRGRDFIFSRKVVLRPVSSLKKRPVSSAASSRLSLPIAMAILLSEPKALMSNGKSVPLFSNRRALPPALTTRSVISAISSTGSAKLVILISSFSFSREFMNSDNPEYMGILNEIKIQGLKIREEKINP
jgi:hypothetical protein